MALQVDVDKAGVVAGALCAVHCALVGLLVAAAPVAGVGFLADHRVEAAFFFIAVCLAGWALVRGLQAHGDWRPGAFLTIGLVCVAVGHFVIGHGGAHGDHVHLSIGLVAPAWLRPLGSFLAVCGGLSLVAFHVLNHRLARRGCRCAVCRNTENPEPAAVPRSPN